jgi:hypothetical protein
VQAKQFFFAEMNPDIGRILTEDELSKHETKVNLLKSEWEHSLPFPPGTLNYIKH